MAADIIPKQISDLNSHIHEYGKTVPTPGDPEGSEVAALSSLVV
jgi:hypothetical protein